MLARPPLRLLARGFGLGLALRRHYSTPPRHFLTLTDLTTPELHTLLRLSTTFKTRIKSPPSPAPAPGPLHGHTVSLLFTKRSTRTRISTEGAVVHLGGHPMFLAPSDIQLGVNESLRDTATILSSMSRALVARVHAHADIVALAAASTVPVINALTDYSHPLQAVADVMTIREAFPGGVEGLKVAWVGDANNVLFDLALACAKLGIHVSVATPQAYPVSDGLLALFRESAAGTGAEITTTHEPEVAVKGANVIVTDTWVSMGQESEKAARLKQFEGFQVTEELARRGGADSEWRFMHCLPRKGEEVDDEVFYSPRSLVFQEAENRLYAAAAALEGFVVRGGELS